MKNFRTFNLAVEFYQQAKGLKLSASLKDQLHRAAQSIALNLAEGKGKLTPKDQLRFFSIAFGSVRECQAILILAELQETALWRSLDNVAAHLFQLIKFYQRG